MKSQELLLVLKEIPSHYTTFNYSPTMEHSSLAGEILPLVQKCKLS